MNLRALERFCESSWHILPSAFEGLLLAILNRGDGEGISKEARKEGSQEGEGEVISRSVISNQSAEVISNQMERRPKVDYWGDEIAQMMITPAGLAIVPIHGPLMNGATGFDKYRFGVIAHEDVADDLDEAINQGASAILLDIHSPGGTVAGTPELAAKIDDLAGVMDVYSFNRGLSASAAEYVSAGVTARFAVPSSINGSIGTILQTVDISKLLEWFGVTVNTFASGKYKGMGSPYKALTDEQRDFLKGMVNNLGAEFAGHMKMHRPSMQAEHFEGQVFRGKEAVGIGLLDEVVRSRAEVMQLVG